MDNRILSELFSSAKLNSFKVYKVQCLLLTFYMFIAVFINFDHNTLHSILLLNVAFIRFLTSINYTLLKQQLFFKAPKQNSFLKNHSIPKQILRKEIKKYMKKIIKVP